MSGLNRRYLARCVNTPVRAYFYWLDSSVTPVSNILSMLQNYITLAWRNLAKNKVFSFINIAGLSIGLACVITITGYVHLELNYDRFHSEADNIYRVTTDFEHDGAHEHSAQNFAPLASLLLNNMSGLKKAVRIYLYSGLVSIDQEHKAREDKFCFVDSTFFEVFNCSVIDGSVQEALSKPFSVVITRSAAVRYFGNVDVAGQQLFLEDSRKRSSFNIAAVIEDMPQNSHFKFDFAASFISLQDVFPKAMSNWHHPPMYLYLKMADGLTVASVDEQLKITTDKHLPDYVKAENRTFLAQKITDIHLHSNLTNEWEANSSYSYVKIFVIIAVFILVIACINYMNLATAKSFQRAVEVGIRKTMGSHRYQLMTMFLGESLITTSIALIIGIALAQVAGSVFFEEFLQKDLAFDFLKGEGMLSMIGGLLIISLMAGMYPAFYLSSFRPVKALKGKTENAGVAIGLRKGLVAFQFFISALLLIGTFVVIQQIDYLKSKDLGFDKEHVITVVLSDRESQENVQVLKNTLLQESFVESASVSASLPTGDGFHNWEIIPEGFKDHRDLSIKSVNADEDFIKTYNIRLVSGRDFSKDIAADNEEAFILNEAAVKKFGWDDAIGKEFQLTYYTDGPVVRKGHVIGVVEDFHFQSLYNRIEPLVIFINTHRYYTDFISAKLKPGNLGDQVRALEEIWKSLNPDKPFEFSFLDTTLDNVYKGEQRTSSLLSTFTGLSVFVSCLGLFGLASFSVQQRTKEIGVRKVMGASVLNIFQLLSKEFIILVVIANLAAWPVAWFGAQHWLNKFAYHVDFSYLIFFTTLIIILTITIATIIIKIIKTALVNPIRWLRYE